MLVTSEAEFGAPGDDGQPALIAERGVRPGFFLLAPTADLPGEIAQIERETGRITAGDETLTGARLDPAWAGGAAMLSVSDGPPQAEPVPAAISDRQFAQQLAILGVITEAEAIARAARGDLPAAVETAVDQLPEDARFPARMLLSAATIYEFDHPLAPALGALLGFSEAERGEIWRAAALL
ncbi:hypothetical protein [Bosea sp. (in: a-proteobacteria)]|uniref:hypothetical protein n=1 Tax=Bosea sp. (in: a-proteobacteria) TaxID=1871050 RepID=UPI00260AAE56|nr:hypothetical protein [Bosea sp. (in: a-proteobacteria)]MCO5092069.1 hypothetical protein [Bosea sp. (in: a-proteobacteria)]